MGVWTSKRNSTSSTSFSLSLVLRSSYYMGGDGGVLGGIGSARVVTVIRIDDAQEEGWINHEKSGESYRVCLTGLEFKLGTIP